MKENAVEVNIEWPNMVVSFGPIELTYDLDDIIEIEGDVSLLEVTDYGLVIEYGDNETEFIDMRPLTNGDLEEEFQNE